MLFELNTLGAPRDIVLDGGPDPLTDRRRKPSRIFRTAEAKDLRLAGILKVAGLNGNYTKLCHRESGRGHATHI